VIDDSAISASTRISAVTFNFGTGPDTFLPGDAIAIPEPSTWAMTLLGFAALGYAAAGRRRTSTSALA
jgi:hypothetical protein